MTERKVTRLADDRAMTEAGKERIEWTRRDGRWLLTKSGFQMADGRWVMTPYAGAVDVPAKASVQRLLDAS